MADQGHSHGGEACSGHGHDHGHSHGAPDKAEELTDYDGEGFVEVPGTDGGLLKKILTEGSGDETPIKGNMVSVHYVGTLTKTGNKFDSSRDRSGTFEFSVGTGQVIKGWDSGIVTMKKGEKCILRCSAEYGYGKRGSPPKIPGGACLDFEVELFKWWEKEKELWEMEDSEKIELAEKHKATGNTFFKAGSLEDAVEAYTKGYDLVKEMADNDGDDGAKAKALAVALALNGAQARLKLGTELSEAATACTDALKWDPNNVKALFRRAQAKHKMSDFAAATADLDLVLGIDANNVDAKNEKSRVAVAAAKSAKAEKAMYGKMFG